VVAAVVLSVVALLGSCGGGGGGGEDLYLAALREDPLSSYAPPGAEPEMSTEQARKDPSGLGKGQQAKILRSFRTDGPAGTTAAIDDALARAQDAGWVFDGRYDQGATLTRPGPAASTMRLTVATNTTEPSVVSISMAAG